MTLAQQFNALQLDTTNNADTLTQPALLSLLDLTCLNHDATDEAIRTLANNACLHHTAAVCVYPEHLNLIPADLPIQRATVVNFPSGEEPHADVIEKISQIASTQNINEIDYVFPYTTYLQGREALALSRCYEAYTLSKQLSLTFKVILETGALPSLEVIYELSQKIIRSGTDFLKTSTGKIPIGATLSAAFAILTAINDSNATCGIKLSGGIRTREQALAYTQLAQHIKNKTPDPSWFRFGASTLI